MPVTIVTIRPLEASLSHGVAFTKMDPYVSIWLGNDHGETQTCYNGGRTPCWSDTIRLQRTNKHDRLHFHVLDRNSVMSDKLIGQVKFRFSQMSGTQFDGWIPLRYDGRCAGQLRVSITIPDQEPNPPRCNPAANSPLVHSPYSYPALQPPPSRHQNHTIVWEGHWIRIVGPPPTPKQESTQAPITRSIW